MVSLLLLILFSHQTWAEPDACKYHEFTGRYVMEYDENGRHESDVFSIEPDGQFTTRDRSFGGSVSMRTDKDETGRYVFRTSMGECTFHMHLLSGGKTIIMKLVHAVPPPACPPTSTLSKTEYQPYAIPSVISCRVGPIVKDVANKAFKVLASPFYDTTTAK